MQTKTQASGLSPLAEQALVIYEKKLKAMLEPAHHGQAVAIQVDTEDYAVGKSHSEAAHALLTRHQPDGRIVTLTIGPPTDADLRLAMRIPAGQRQ
jgi:hypothetical protein